jgi:hypothetical protein
MINRNVDDLHRQMCVKMNELIEYVWKQLGIRLKSGETHRLDGRQNSLYRLGRDIHGNIIDKDKVVTYKKGGGSKHGLTRKSDGKKMACAVHLWVVRPDGKVLGLPRLGPAGVLVYRAVAACAKQLGLRHGASWKDYTHVELTGDDWKNAKEDAAR